VVLVHGGSWVSGDKANFGDTAPDFLPWWHARGFATAAVNFRLASPLGEPLTVGPMDQAQDLAHALAWLAAEADDLGVDGSAPVLVGYSSGAHLVALLGADSSYLSGAGMPEGAIKATVSLDVHAYDVPFALSLMEGSVVEDNIPQIEHLFGTTENAQLQASPIAYAADDVAPALLVSVEPDPAEPGTHGHIVNEAAQRYAAALQASGNVAQTFHDSGESHASLAVGFGASGDRTTETVGAFLDALEEASP
jgi:acetyl esterase/lipase